MSELNAMTAILKFINGRNDNADSLRAVCDYTTDNQPDKGSYIETPIVLAMILGLRRSEIIGITWDNVDFENKMLHIRQSVVVGDSSILPKDTFNVIGNTQGKKKESLFLNTFSKQPAVNAAFI